VGVKLNGGGDSVLHGDGVRPVVGGARRWEGDEMGWSFWRKWGCPRGARKKRAGDKKTKNRNEGRQRKRNDGKKGVSVGKWAVGP